MAFPARPEQLLAEPSEACVDAQGNAHGLYVEVLRFSTRAVPFVHGARHGVEAFRADGEVMWWSWEDGRRSGPWLEARPGHDIRVLVVGIADGDGSSLMAEYRGGGDVLHLRSFAWTAEAQPLPSGVLPGARLVNRTWDSDGEPLRVVQLHDVEGESGVDLEWDEDGLRRQLQIDKGLASGREIKRGCRGRPGRVLEMVSGEVVATRLERSLRRCPLPSTCYSELVIELDDPPSTFDFEWESQLIWLEDLIDLMREEEL